ncbi:hypothetical protein IT575_08215 [bacterium]|nr:hypothetical protein [bacterium]
MHSTSLSRLNSAATVWLLLCALLLLCPSHALAQLPHPGFLPDPEPQPQQSNREYGRFLVLRPAEYSRFEISPEGHVVVFFPLGVEGWYMGYYLRAGQLRYDQATEAVSLSGGVLFRMPGYALSCASLSLDGRAGRGEIPGTFSGVYAERGLYFQAGRAEISFPPNLARQEQQIGLSKVGLRLLGGVRASDKFHNTLITEALSLDGAAGTVSTAGAFDLLVSSRDASSLPATSGASDPGGGPPPWVKAGPAAAPTGAPGAGSPSGPPPWVKAGAAGPPSFGDFESVEFFPMLVSGSGLSAQISEAEGLSNLRISQPLLRAEAMSLSADEARLNLSALSGADDSPEPSVLSGSPVLAVLRQGPTRQLVLRAGEISLLSLPEQGYSLSLSGTASISTPEGAIAAESLNVTSRGESYSVDFPDGLDLSFNIAELGDSGLLLDSGD